MSIIKTGDRYEAVNSDGFVVAYIVKNYMGTHGHSRGWEHYVYCRKVQDYARGDAVSYVYQDDSFRDIPWTFRNIKQFSEYYAADRPVI